MSPTRVVLDCDTANEVDDQFAIVHALGVPGETLEVRGVVSVHNTTAHGPPAKIVVDPGPFAEELRDLDRPIASYLAELLKLWSAEYEAPETRKELWDLACVAAVTDPDSVTAGPRALPTLDAAGAHDFTQPGRAANVVSDLDERRILAGLMEALTSHPAG